jgi:DNA adenine methylase
MALRSTNEAVKNEYARAPFPYFGGKTHCSGIVWEAFGDTVGYVEPFAGSLGNLLQRPHWPFVGAKRMETVNDLDGMISNFWRCIKADPDALTFHIQFPVIERDLIARHYWLVTEGRTILKRNEGDPDFYDAKIAGWWAWGLSSWFGSGWCDGRGPWRWTGEEWEKMPRDRDQDGVTSQRPHLGDFGQGVNAKRPHLGNFGKGVNAQNSVSEWIAWLSDRMSGVRVCNGDWSRVCTPTATGERFGDTAIFLDPPYANTADRDPDLYAMDSLTVAHDVREWAIDAFRERGLRIVMAGLDSEHVFPDDWTVIPWKFKPGQGNTKTGYGREVLWVSPNCNQPGAPTQSPLF